MIMNKFKIGDKVENIDSTSSGDRNYGKVGIVDDISGERVYVEYDYGCNGSSPTPEKDYKLVKAVKTKPPKFLLQYELDEDPVEYFETLPKLRKRLKELVKDSTLKRHTVRVIEIKKEYNVEIKDNISITIK